MRFAIISLACTIMMFLTCWLILPLLVLPPVAVYFGWKGYREIMSATPHASPAVRLLALSPMFIAVAAVPLTMAFINTGYQA